MDILGLLHQYHYTILLPLSVIAGVPVAIGCGVLIATGDMHLLPVVGILLFADTIGDTFFYFIGRNAAGFLSRYGYKIGLTQEKIKIVSVFYKENQRKAIYIAKLSMALGIIGLLYAGIAKVDFFKYLGNCLTVTTIRAFMLIGIGYFFVDAFYTIEKMLNVYVAWFTMGILLVLVLVFFYKYKFIK